MIIMKPSTLLLLAAMSATAATSTPPDQNELTALMQEAAAAWGTAQPIRAIIQLAPLGKCSSFARHQVGWTEFATNTITVNSNCEWTDKALLRAVVTHELGHVLLGTPEHSADKKSVMYFTVRKSGQSITEADKQKRTKK